MPRKAGIPYKSVDEQHSERVQIRMTKQELKRLDEAAGKLGITRSLFLRTAVENLIAETES